MVKDRSFQVEWLKKGGKGGSPLHRACLTGQIEIVALLLEKGSPLDARDDQGYTPLLSAASQRHFDIVKQLLELGANSSLENETGSSLLHYLIRTEPPLTEEQRNMLEYCLTSGVDVNCRNRYGETPLHQACMRKHLSMCEFLLKSGATVNAINKFGESALHKACTAISLPLINLFISHGADPTIQSAHGTPLDMLRDLENQAGINVDIVKDLKSALTNYESSYERPMVNINDAGPNFQPLSDAMQRTKAITGQSFTSSTTNQPTLKDEDNAVPPQVSFTAAAEIGIGISGVSERPDPPAASPRNSLARHGWRPRESLASLPEDSSSEEQCTPSRSRSGHLSPRVFGAIGSGSRHSRSNSVHLPEPPVFSNSPQVSRLLRQPVDSGESSATLFTPDSSFRQESSGFGRLDDMKLMKIAKVYGDEFYGRDHLVFLSSGGVVCVLQEKTRHSYGVCVFEASKGFQKMAIPALQMDNVKDFVAGCLSWIELNVFPSRDVWLVDDDAEIKNELKKIEANAPESSQCYRVGVVYCGENHTTEAEMFQSPTDIPSFSDFLNIIGEEIELEGWGGYRGQLSVSCPGTSYYAQFRGAEIMFHVSTLMTAEQHRRLIGNDTAIIYFHDSEKTPFPSSAPRSIMGQVFGVVKPADSGSKLQFGVMSRKTVVEFGPEMPLNPSFDILTHSGREVFRSFLLAKIINGYRSATLSPPLDKMLKRPRVVQIANLVETYPMSATKKKFTIRAKRK